MLQIQRLMFIKCLALKQNEFPKRKVRRYLDIQWQKALPCHVFNSPDHEPCSRLNFIYQELAEENHQMTAAAGRCGMSNATLWDPGKPAEEQDRWCGQRHTHLTGTSASHTSVHNHSSHTGTQQPARWQGDISQPPECTSRFAIKWLSKHDSALSTNGLFDPPDGKVESQNAWWSFLLPFLKGVSWTCWLEEVMARDKYGFLGQKNMTPEMLRRC